MNGRPEFFTRRALDAPTESLAVISRDLVDRAVAYSRHNARRRIIQPLHRSGDEPVHRMLNAVQPGSYVRPHRHKDPPKSESWILVRGALVFFAFDDEGRIIECLKLDAGGEAVGVDLVPGVYHTFTVLDPDTVIYEVKTGPYVEATDKAFAPWAPEEGTPAADAYLASLVAAYRREHAADDPLGGVSWRPPVLRTERLILRGYESSDAPAIYSYASDAETTRDMAWNRHRSVEDAFAFLHGMVAANYRRQQLDYAICPAGEPERVIGGVSACAQPEPHAVMELGYILARPYWGQGLAVEAVTRLLDHAFQTTNVERVFAPIFAENARSRRFAEKVGMRLDGVLRSARVLRGRRWDEAIYAVLRSDWPGRVPESRPRR